jgi:hypothetical protein
VLGRGLGDILVQQLEPSKMGPVAGFEFLLGKRRGAEPGPNGKAYSGVLEVLPSWYGDGCDEDDDDDTFVRIERVRIERALRVGQPAQRPLALRFACLVLSNVKPT